MAQRIKKGDMVLVLSGKDRGVRGEVIRVDPKKGTAVVEGANVATRHVKQQQGVAQTGIIHGEAPIRLSKLMLVDSDTQLPGRAEFKFLEDGRKVRVVKRGKRS
jgi:large subunit ribosomal protein L24